MHHLPLTGGHLVDATHYQLLTGGDPIDALPHRVERQCGELLLIERRGGSSGQAEHPGSILGSW
jgi:hypothetical protein